MGTCIGPLLSKASPKFFQQKGYVRKMIVNFLELPTKLCLLVFPTFHTCLFSFSICHNIHETKQYKSSQQTSNHAGLFMTQHQDILSNFPEVNTYIFCVYYPGSTSLLILPSILLKNMMTQELKVPLSSVSIHVVTRARKGVVRGGVEGGCGINTNKEVSCLKSGYSAPDKGAFPSFPPAAARRNYFSGSTKPDVVSLSHSTLYL